MYRLYVMLGQHSAPWIANQNAIAGTRKVKQLKYATLEHLHAAVRYKLLAVYHFYYVQDETVLPKTLFYSFC